jgi:hypothetical protein
MRFRRLCEHRCPGVKGGTRTHPYLVRAEHGNPVGVPTLCAASGRPIVRKAESPGGTGRPKKRTPAAERQQETGMTGLRLLRPSRITGRIQANAWRESELTWVW